MSLDPTLFLSASPTDIIEMTESIPERMNAFDHLALNSTIGLKPSQRTSLTYITDLSSPSLVSEPSTDVHEEGFVLLTPTELHEPTDRLTCDDTPRTTAILPHKRQNTTGTQRTSALFLPSEVDVNTTNHKRPRGNSDFVLKMRRRSFTSAFLFREITGSTKEVEDIPSYDQSCCVEVLHMRSSEYLSTPRTQGYPPSKIPPAVQRATEDELPLTRCHSGIFLPLLS